MTTPPSRPCSCPTCSSIGPRRLIEHDGQGAFPCPDPWHQPGSRPDLAHPEREVPQEMLMGTLPDGSDRTGRLIDVEPLTGADVCGDAEPETHRVCTLAPGHPGRDPEVHDDGRGTTWRWTTTTPALGAAPAPRPLEDLIAANPVAKAAMHFAAAETSWRTDAGTAAEAALRAALEADATAAEVRRLEVEALQAAARKHREDAARLRDTVTRAAGDLDREDVNPRYVRDGLLRALGETRTEG